MACRIDPRIAWQVVAGSVVCVDIDDGVACGFNEVGSFIWQLLGAHDEEAIVHKVAAEFLVEVDSARADLQQFMELLRARRLVVEGP